MLCEDKRTLKTRILAILRYKRNTKLTAVISCLLVLALAGCGVALGARYAPNNSFYMPIEADTIFDLHPKTICANILSTAGYPDGELFLYTGQAQAILNAEFGLNFFHWDVLLRVHGTDGDKYRYCRIGFDPVYETQEPSLFVQILDERAPMTDAPPVPLKAFLEALVELPDDAWVLKDPDSLNREPDGWTIHCWGKSDEFQFGDNEPTVYGKDSTRESSQYLVINVTPLHSGSSDENSPQLSGGPGKNLLYAYGDQAAKNAEHNQGANVMHHMADSPDGKFRLETHGVSPDIYASGAYPCESIRIVDIQTDEVRWQMGGWLDEELSWSPDGRYAVVSYMNRVSWNTLLVDTADMSEITLPGMQELAARRPEHPSVNTERPDPDFRSGGWNDESTLLVNFSWRKDWDDMETGEDISGVFGFNVAKKEILFINWDDPDCSLTGL